MQVMQRSCCIAFPYFIVRNEVDSFVRGLGVAPVGTWDGQHSAAMSGRTSSALSLHRCGQRAAGFLQFLVLLNNGYDTYPTEIDALA